MHLSQESERFYRTQTGLEQEELKVESLIQEFKHERLKVYAQVVAKDKAMGYFRRYCRRDQFYKNRGSKVNSEISAASGHHLLRFQSSKEACCGVKINLVWGSVAFTMPSQLTRNMGKGQIWRLI